MKKQQGEFLAQITKLDVAVGSLICVGGFTHLKKFPIFSNISKKVPATATPIILAGTNQKGKSFSSGPWSLKSVASKAIIIFMLCTCRKFWSDITRQRPHVVRLENMGTLSLQKFPDYNLQVMGGYVDMLSLLSLLTFRC